MSEVISTRVEVLQEAIKLTLKDRDQVYGDPGTNMRVFAALLNAYFSFSASSRGVLGVSAHDAAMVMVLAKVARIAVCSKSHTDNYVDAAAYLAIAKEVDTR